MHRLVSSQPIGRQPRRFSCLYIITGCIGCKLHVLLAADVPCKPHGNAGPIDSTLTHNVAVLEVGSAVVLPIRRLQWAVGWAPGGSFDEWRAPLHCM